VGAIASPPRLLQLLPFRLWYVAAGIAAVWIAAVARGGSPPGRVALSEYGATRGTPDEGDQMSTDEERLALAREIQAYDVRLGLLPPFGTDPRNAAFRAELQRSRDLAAHRLAELETDGDGLAAEARKSD
jgi:hypothetical protein